MPLFSDPNNQNSLFGGQFGNTGQWSLQGTQNSPNPNQYDATTNPFFQTAP